MAQVRSVVILLTFAVVLSAVPGALALAATNDHFVNATLLSGEAGHVQANNYSASKEPGEPNHAGDPGGASVWFTWTAPRSGRLFLDTCSSPDSPLNDSLLAMYTGDTLASLTSVAANNNSCGLRSALETDVIAGSVYRIAVDEVGGGGGTYELAWAMAPEAGATRPPNDAFENATPLSGYTGTVDGTNLAATHELGEPRHGDRGGSGSAWYRWTAPETAWSSFNTCPRTFHTVVSVYRGASLAALVLVIKNGDRSCHTSFIAQAGVSYSVAVDGPGPANRGTFKFAWNLTPNPPRAVAPPSITGSRRIGEVLTGVLGEWSGVGLSFEFWWEGCPRQPCLPQFLPGTMGARTFLPDGGQALVRFVVRARNQSGVTTASSKDIPILLPPKNVSPPEIKAFARGSVPAGDVRFPRVGDKLAPNAGKWDSHSPLDYFYFEWQRCRAGTTVCRTVHSGSEMQEWNVLYTLKDADVGSIIRLIVRARNIDGSASATSAPTGMVTSASRPVTRSRCVVPRLIGKTIASARKMLSRSRCRLGTVRRVRSRQRVGRIVRQSLRPGKRVRAGARVNVRVSAGRR